jgi:protein-disulfide isomerase
MSESQPKIQIPTINPNLVVILIIFQFFFSTYLYFKVAKLETGGSVAKAGNAADVSPAPAAPTENLSAMPAVNDKDLLRGNKDADITLVEYSDLECPFCKQFHTTMQQAMTEYGDKINWVYRHYPLSFHPKAQKSAESIACANELGGSDLAWQMIDTIYEKMPAVEVTEYAGIAGNLGIDQTAFQNCVDSGKYADMIKKEEAEGAKAGVQGTPGTIVVSKKTGKKAFIGGAYPIDEIRAKIAEVSKK